MSVSWPDLGSRQFLLSLFVTVVFASSAVEITLEFAAGESLSTMADDVLWFVVSAALLAIFLTERHRQKAELGALRNQLSRARGKLAQLDTRTQELGAQYRAVIQKQFDAWELSASEQDIVILMLKGLSFREIAELRNTRDKTVRQQASSVYRKAGVSGRNELVAWFFDDVLEPNL